MEWRSPSFPSRKRCSDAPRHLIVVLALCSLALGPLSGRKPARVLRGPCWLLIGFVICILSRTKAPYALGGDSKRSTARTFSSPVRFAAQCTSKAGEGQMNQWCLEVRFPDASESAHFEAWQDLMESAISLIQDYGRTVDVLVTDPSGKSRMIHRGLPRHDTSRFLPVIPCSQSAKS